MIGNPEQCKEYYHRCICFDGAKTCRNPDHLCICKKDSTKCLSLQHECLCEISNHCIAIKHKCKLEHCTESAQNELRITDCICQKHFTSLSCA